MLVMWEQCLCMYMLSKQRQIKSSVKCQAKQYTHIIIIAPIIESAEFSKWFRSKATLGDDHHEDRYALMIAQASLSGIRLGSWLVGLVVVVIVKKWFRRRRCDKKKEEVHSISINGICVHSLYVSAYLLAMHPNTLYTYAFARVHA